MTKVIKASSVDLSQHEIVATFESREEAVVYIAEHTVDGVNCSAEQECDYLQIDGDDE